MNVHSALLEERLPQVEDQGKGKVGYEANAEVE